MQLSRPDARRVAIRAQLLDAVRPADVVEVAEQLTVINIDPTAAVAPSEDLLLWSRIGFPYDHAQLKKAVEVDREIFELLGMYRPIGDLPLFLPAMRAAPRYSDTRQWLTANETFRRDILRLLGESGPLLSGEVPDTSSVPWPSSGWTNNRNVTQMLEVLSARGEVAIATDRLPVCTAAATDAFTKPVVRIRRRRNARSVTRSRTRPFGDGLFDAAGMHVPACRQT